MPPFSRLPFSRMAALALSGAVALGAVLPATANADEFTLSIGGDGPRFGGYVDDDGPRRPHGGWDRGRDGDWDGGSPRWERRGPPPRCSPDQALDKAARMGLRRVRIVDVDRRTIEVSGRRFGDRRIVTFARAPFCPVIDW